MIPRCLVAVKRVIDYATKVRVLPNNLGVQTTNVKHSLNPFDEIAIEASLRLRASQQLQEILAVSIGPKSNDETLRTALAMGCDRAMRVDVDDNVESLAVAKCLKKVVEKEDVGLVILGKQAIDGDCAMTGAMLAAMLDWTQATCASEIHVQDDKHVRVTREVDTGLQTLRLQLPSVITCDLRLNTPRYATLPNVMKAKRKKIETVTPKELQVDVTPMLEVVKVEEPPKRKAGVILENVDELVDRLRNEAKVI